MREDLQRAHHFVGYVLGGLLPGFDDALIAVALGEHASAERALGIVYALFRVHQDRLLGFRHDDSAVRGAIHIGFFHRAAILHLIGSRKLDDPLIRHDLRSCAAGTAAHLEQFIQIARILVIQYRMTLSGKLVQIANRSILLDIPRRTIRQRAHSRITDDRQTLQLRHIRRKNSPRL